MVRRHVFVLRDDRVKKTAFVVPQSGWEVRLSSSRGVPYYYNNLTQASVWDAPSGLTEAQIRALPGASHLEHKPKEVRASHILVKHSGSRRPSSWKEASLTLSSVRAGGFFFFFFNFYR
jgi:NIMA-interacting peptidyl-prolyl cis-trans isomerase 1